MGIRWDQTNKTTTQILWFEWTNQTIKQMLWLELTNRHIINMQDQKCTLHFVQIYTRNSLFMPRIYCKVAQSQEEVMIFPGQDCKDGLMQREVSQRVRYVAEYNMLDPMIRCTVQHSVLSPITVHACDRLTLSSHLCTGTHQGTTAVHQYLVHQYTSTCYTNT